MRGRSSSKRFYRLWRKVTRKVLALAARLICLLEASRTVRIVIHLILYQRSEPKPLKVAMGIEARTIPK